jgi:hypothetical protein
MNDHQCNLYVSISAPTTTLHSREYWLFFSVPGNIPKELIVELNECRIINVSIPRDKNNLVLADLGRTICFQGHQKSVLRLPDPLPNKTPGASITTNILFVSRMNVQGKPVYCPEIRCTRWSWLLATQPSLPVYCHIKKLPSWDRTR